MRTKTRFVYRLNKVREVLHGALAIFILMEMRCAFDCIGKIRDSTPKAVLCYLQEEKIHSTTTPYNDPSPS